MTSHASHDDVRGVIPVKAQDKTGTTQSLQIYKSAVCQIPLSLQLPAQWRARLTNQGYKNEWLLCCYDNWAAVEPAMRQYLLLLALPVTTLITSTSQEFVSSAKLTCCDQTKECAVRMACVGVGA